MELITASHGTQRVFPLVAIINHGGGYFINDRGEVFSICAGTPARMLAGQAHGGYLNGIRNRGYSLRGQYHTRFVLLRMAQRKTDLWNVEMGGAATVECGIDEPVAKQAVLTDRTHGTVAQGQVSNGTVIARVSKRGPVEFLEFGSDPKIHLTPESLKSEMTRLAMANPGVRYVALKIGQSVVFGGIQWS